MQRKPADEELEGKPAEEALKKLQAELDRRVGERTAELLKANHELKKEIAERKETENTLRESEKRLKIFYDAAFEGLAITEGGRLIDVNNRFAEIFGYDRDDLMGKAIIDLVAADDRERVLGNIRSGMKEPYEHRAVYKDGSDIFLEVHGVRTQLHGRPVRVTAIHDITKRKRIEAEKANPEVQFQQAQRMEAIGTLAGCIAHDFNNILTPIIVRTEMALSAAPAGSGVQANLEQVLEASNRAKNRVGQILAFSRQGERDQKPLKLGPIIKEALKLLRASILASIEIHQDIETESDTVLADPVQMHQIVMNLCTNAAYAMRLDGGVLTVRLDQKSIDAQARHPDLEPGPYMRLTVKDTGPGIDAKIIDRIFDPFFTTKERGEGTGMGLSVVHGIVKNSGGAIKVESEPEKGTTFEILIPRIADDDHPGIHEVEMFSALPGGSERILLIDDEKYLLEAVSQMLKQLGYKVDARGDVLEALNLFRQTPDKYDLVITDQTMPIMTGYKLAQELMRIRPGVPVILCTAYPSYKDNFMSWAADAYVVKSMDLTELKEKIKDSLAKKNQ